VYFRNSFIAMLFKGKLSRRRERTGSDSGRNFLMM